MNDSDREANRFTARAARYARVGANVGGVAARMAGTRLMRGEGQRASNAAALAQALGGLKGPIMKVAQLLATIPDVIPPEYAAELQKLQSEAPPMGAAFVKRRMQAELGPDWQAPVRLLRPQAGGGRFPRTGSPRDLEGGGAAGVQAAISRHAIGRRGGPEAARIRAFALHRRLDPAIDTREIAKEIGARVREELDYAPRSQACRALLRGAARRARSTRALRRSATSRRGGSSLSAGSRARRSFPIPKRRSKSATVSPSRCSRRGGIPSAMRP